MSDNTPPPPFLNPQTVKKNLNKVISEDTPWQKTGDEKRDLVRQEIYDELSSEKYADERLEEKKFPPAVLAELLEEAVSPLDNRLSTVELNLQATITERQ